MRKKTNLSVIDLVLTHQVDLLEESLRVDNEAALDAVDKLGRNFRIRLPSRLLAGVGRLKSCQIEGCVLQERLLRSLHMAF